MKVETPKDVFLYLSKYLHLYGKACFYSKYSYFICLAIQRMSLKNKISIELEIKTTDTFMKYLKIYYLEYGAFKKDNNYLFNYYELEKRKAFLKFIYELEIKHENNFNKSV